MRNRIIQQLALTFCVGLALIIAPASAGFSAASAGCGASTELEQSPRDCCAARICC